MDTALLHDIASEHDALDALMATHLDRLLAGDLAAALETFDAFAQALCDHMACEEQALFPRLAALPAPRWKVGVYQAEHDRLRLLAAGQRERLVDAAREGGCGAQLRARILALLDAAHPLRHVLDHHQQREASGLLAELAGN